MTNTILNLMYSKEVEVKLTKILELKSMNATEKISVILKLRGLFVSYKKDIYLTSYYNKYYSLLGMSLAY